ncbi:MAG: leucine--tRNA ligase [Chloroflexi bacterium]|nr:leucine--tRNA ligase [Chloroflexota bacterium]
MAGKYIPPEIEKKWQDRWTRDELYKIDLADPRPKYYFLTMYPYPSGDLHTGHWYAEAPADAKARYLRMRGNNVLFPMGFDAFGLPAENAAIKNNIHPYSWTMANIDRMRQQFQTMGAMFDWSREVITCQPEYYRWNQWFFLQFFKQGLAYRQKAAVDWCPNCNTTLAREQVVGEDRRCERCGTPVIKRDLEQWFFRITKYADELLNFDGLDWPDWVKTLQTNWIGRSEGAEIAFGTDAGEPIRVFTTRPDTVYGVTFMVLAPEHPLVERLTTAEQRAAVERYVEASRRESEIERTAADKPKTGVFTGSYCVNPYSGERVPVYVGDYVLASYGTGAVMGVPGHDERDFDFARTYGLAIPVVIAPPDWDGKDLESAYTGPGTMVNSGPFSGAPNQEGKRAVVQYGEGRGFANAAITYRLRDWLISRQRYWGTPIPIIYCPTDGIVPVPESDLPVVLPEDSEFLPTGESPLKHDDRFRLVTCPVCGGPAERETDTMDTFVDSSWYQYRYLSPHDAENPFDREVAAQWMPVNQYTGGVEHAILHLLYFRFFTKAMRDLGLVDLSEPVTRLMNQGMILGPDGQKMSKSRGNVVNPDDYVSTVGADAFRCYLMFIGPWSEGGPYDPKGMEGITRWLNRVWTLSQERYQTRGAPSPNATRTLRRTIHQYIQRVTEDIEGFRFNKMLSHLMELNNALRDAREAGNVESEVWNEGFEAMLLMMAPAAPHLAEELWAGLGRPYSIHQQSWPESDAELAKDEEITVVVQVNGKVRDKLALPVDATEERVRELALASERVQSQVNGADIARVIYVPGRLVNVVLA